MKDELRMDDLQQENFRGVARVAFEGGMARLAAVWSRAGYKNLRAVIDDAVKEFEDKTNIRAEYVYVWALPSGVEEGQEYRPAHFSGDGAVMIFSADWAAPNYVFVCARARGL